MLYSFIEYFEYFFYDFKFNIKVIQKYFVKSSDFKTLMIIMEYKSEWEYGPCMKVFELWNFPLINELNMR